MAGTASGRITLREAAERLGVSEASVRRLFDNGRLEGKKSPGGHRRVSPSSVEALLTLLEQDMPELFVPKLSSTKVESKPLRYTSVDGQVYVFKTVDEAGKPYPQALLTAGLVQFAIFEAAKGGSAKDVLQKLVLWDVKDSNGKAFWPPKGS